MRFIYLSIFIFYFLNCFSQTENFKKDTIKVLFVGNSFSFYYNLPQVVSSMSEFSDLMYIQTKNSLVSGATLQDHINQNKNSKTIEILNSEQFDYVAINHHSLATFNELDEFLRTSKRFIDIVKSKKATPLFIETWAYKSDSSMIKNIAEKYLLMSEKYNVDIIPCGQLFSQVIKDFPDINLFEDEKHPSKNGTYLNGLAFVKYFSSHLNLKIPNRIVTLDKNGEILYLLFINKDVSESLKKIVAKFKMKTFLD